jgi:hypothetical protein
MGRGIRGYICGTASMRYLPFGDASGVGVCSFAPSQATHGSGWRNTSFSKILHGTLLITMFITFDHIFTPSCYVALLGLTTRPVSPE